MSPQHKMEKPCIVGIPFDFTDARAVVDSICERSNPKPLMVMPVNAHTVMNCRRMPEVKAALSVTDLILPDGVGVIIAADILGIPHRGRIPGPALVLEICDRGREEGLRHYFFGGAPGVAHKMAERLTEMFPGTLVCGEYSPLQFEQSYPAELEDCNRINNACADIVWVGLGSPKQELWIARNIGRLRAKAVIGVGAAFDFLSGNKKWAPRWIRRSGLEWAYRLVMEPKRLWRRNLDSPLFLFEVLKQWSQ